MSGLEIANRYDSEKWHPLTVIAFTAIVVIGFVAMVLWG